MRRAGLIVVLHVWWAILSGSYLKNYLSNSVIGGADGSGHVMLVHLFTTHVFPHLTGWLPEPYGGMPFPVFYPPLFYWLGAITMNLTGLSAPVAVKILTTATFAALPGTLYVLGRRVGLKRPEAFLASAWAGVIACGSNVASLSGIGLLGEFEVGLYTQTLGFVWLCLWCAFLPYSQRSWKAATIAVFSLCATILSNVHVLPFAAFYGLCWLALTYFRTQRRLSLVRSLLWLIAPVVIAGIWLVPLISWYRYAVGKPLPAEALFASLGGFNVAWVACVFIAWQERKRHPKLVVLCAAIIISAGVALTPLGVMIKWIPFQPARVLAGPMILVTIPLTKLFANTLLNIVGGERWVVHLSLGVLLVVLAWVHPSQRFGIASFAGDEGESIEQVRRAVQQLPPGKILVELVESNAIFNSLSRSPRDMALSRAISHEIATDGRPVLWTVFREQTLISPFSTATNNLFSTTREQFGMGGLAIEESLYDTLNAAERVRIARHLGVQYYLVRTPPQVELLRGSSDVSYVWNIGEWHLFAGKLNEDLSAVRVERAPVLAWTTARFKNRSATEIELFNLGEAMAFLGHPEISVLWAFSEDVDLMRLLASNSSVTFIIDPSVQPDYLERLLASLGEDATRRLNVILLNEHSRVASLVLAKQQTFASVQSLEVNQTSVKDIATRIVKLDSDQPGNTSSNLWQTKTSYFPAWKTQHEGDVFLTGQGTMALLGPQPPSLRWETTRVQALAIAVCVVGLLLLVLNLRISHKKY